MTAATLHVSSASELIDALCDSSLRAPIFRGHSDASFSLVPSSLRSVQATDNVRRLGRVLRSQESDLDRAEMQVHFELAALIAFFAASDRQGLSVPGPAAFLRRFIHEPNTSLAAAHILRELDGPWLPETLFDLAALAQHYGVPTRLLDWSFNPLVACYFATRESNSRFIAICVCETDVRMFRLRVVTPPYAANPNLAAQKGVFTTIVTEPPLATDGPGTVDRRAHDEHAQTGPFTRYVLSRDHVPDLQSLLIRLGVTTAGLFPGYHGVVDEMT